MVIGGALTTMEELLTKETNMNIFVPAEIVKSTEVTVDSNGTETSVGDWYVRGYASTPDLDLQGEVVEPQGIDINYFIKSGYINYEHSNRPEHIIGVPTENSYVDFQKGLFVEAKLMKSNEYAQELWRLANNLNNDGMGRKIGFSIEGKVRKRNTVNKNVIESVMITNVALTTHPANPNATWETLVKSWQTGVETNPAELEDAEALRREKVLSAMTVIAEARKSNDTGLWNQVSKMLKETERNDKDTDILLLQLAKGLSYNEANSFVSNLTEKGD